MHKYAHGEVNTNGPNGAKALGHGVHTALAVARVAQVKARAAVEAAPDAHETAVLVDKAKTATTAAVTSEEKLRLSKFVGGPSAARVMAVRANDSLDPEEKKQQEAQLTKLARDRNEQSGTFWAWVSDWRARCVWGAQSLRGVCACL